MKAFFPHLEKVSSKATNPKQKDELTDCYKDIYKWLG